MNIRQLTHHNPNYYEINREERNYAAILYAALCKSGNPERFLRSLNLPEIVGPEFAIYFEYSFLRDLWKTIESEDTKKIILKNLLAINDIDQILRSPLEKINRKFGVPSQPSTKYLQNPSNWSIQYFNENFADNDDFLKICKFKWSFKIKPDIVIHLDKDTAICIEAKHTSGEGKYPSSSQEKKIFKDRGLNLVQQTELQKYMMEELLGIKTTFLFLVSKKVNNPTHRVITWNEAFNSIDMSEMPKFATAMAKSISD